MGYVPFVLATLRTPYQFCVGRGVVREVRYRPKAGIGQGDLFSPVLFSFCVVFVLHLLSKIQGTEDVIIGPLTPPPPRPAPTTPPPPYLPTASLQD